MYTTKNYNNHPHYRVCGLHPIQQPSSSIKYVLYKCKVPDNFNLYNETYEVIELDGKNWQKAFKELNKVIG